MHIKRKMTAKVPDRFKAANAFWIGLTKIGLTPAAVLSQARMPVTVYDGKKNLVTTGQFFALWRAVGELSSDPAAGLKIATQISVGADRRQRWRPFTPATIEMLLLALLASNNCAHPRNCKSR